MLPLRFVKKIDASAGDCWLWVAQIDGCGYGRFQEGGKPISAHRYAYEALVGQIPDGLTIDHLCRVRHCVNPEHMEAVTRRENTLRGIGPTAMHARRTHCPQGHPYDEENTCLHGTSRSCRTCHRISERQRRQRRAA